MSSQHALHDLRREMARKIVGYAKNDMSDEAPGVAHFDVSTFLDAELFAREHERLFRNTPQMACLSSDLPAPGSYLVFEDLGAPMFVMRGKDGRVRAFLNACPHRGARVIRDERGAANRFTCRFHGWTFDSTGQVIAVPREQQFCGEIEDRKHLVACPAEERHGIVFVQATPNSSMDLDAHLADFGPQLDVLGLEDAKLVKSDAVHCKSNWKYTLDTYFENYHLPSLHRDSFANIFASNLCIFETWGSHHRFVFPQRSIYEWMHKPEEEWEIDALPFTLFLFPNTVISVGSVTASGSLVSIHRLFPHSVGELTTQLTMYAAHGIRSEAHRAEIEASYHSIMQAVREEDYSVTTEGYVSLAAFPKGTKFPVGRQEIGVQNFHRNVERALASQ